jgi:hypothetical protein
VSERPFVLRALNILGIEEILKLSEVIQNKQKPLKKAAGAEVIVWDDETEEREPKQIPNPEKVLPFPKKTVQNLPQLTEEHPPEEKEKAEELITSDLMLWQREMSKHKGETLNKIEGFSEYQRSNDVQVIKTHNNAGKQEVRFVPTNGVLINKKQA